jgi:hypothetical protein
LAEGPTFEGHLLDWRGGDWLAFALLGDVVQSELLLVHGLLEGLFHPDPLDLFSLLQADLGIKLIDVIVSKLV